MEKRNENKNRFGQYFTNSKTVKDIINLLTGFKEFDNDIKILEPSFGIGNFIKELKNRNFKNIEGCEIDNELFENNELKIDLYEKISSISH